MRLWHRKILLGKQTTVGKVGLESLDYHFPVTIYYPKSTNLCLLVDRIERGLWICDKRLASYLPLLSRLSPYLSPEKNAAQSPRGDYLAALVSSLVFSANPVLPELVLAMFAMDFGPQRRHNLSYPLAALIVSIAPFMLTQHHLRVTLRRMCITELVLSFASALAMFRDISCKGFRASPFLLFIFISFDVMLSIVLCYLHFFYFFIYFPSYTVQNHIIAYATHALHTRYFAIPHLAFTFHHLVDQCHH